MRAIWLALVTLTGVATAEAGERTYPAATEILVDFAGVGAGGFEEILRRIVRTAGQQQADGDSRSRAAARVRYEHEREPIGAREGAVNSTPGPPL